MLEMAFAAELGVTDAGKGIAELQTNCPQSGAARHVEWIERCRRAAAISRPLHWLVLQSSS